MYPKSADLEAAGQADIMATKRRDVSPPGVERKSTVVMAFEDLETSILKMQVLACRLAEKLQPVLMEDGPSNPSDICRSRDCPFASAVGEASDRISSLNRDIENLIDRIDL